MEKSTIIIGDTKQSRRVLARLDMFYVRKEKWKVSIKPQHLVIMEFLGACGFALSRAFRRNHKLLKTPSKNVCES